MHTRRGKNAVMAATTVRRSTHSTHVKGLEHGALGLDSTSWRGWTDAAEGGGDRDKGHSRGRFLPPPACFFLPFSPYLRDRGTTASRRCRFDDSGVLCPAPTGLEGPYLGPTQRHVMLRYFFPSPFRLIGLYEKRMSSRCFDFFPINVSSFL